MTALSELLTADELGDRLGRGKRWVYRQHEERGLPAFKVGRSLLFDQNAVLAWLKRQQVGDWNGVSG